MSIKAIIEGVIGREGRYSNNPADAGGETMWGITAKTARSYGYDGPMCDMPRDVAAQIYIKQYVMGPGFDKIVALNYKIGEKLVDAGVNCGPARPGPWLQRTLNLLNRQAKQFPDLVVDGVLGPATQFALLAVLKHRGTDGELVILECLKGLQVAHYMDITEHRPQNEEFFFGWIKNRVLEAA